MDNTIKRGTKLVLKSPAAWIGHPISKGSICTVQDTIAPDSVVIEDVDGVWPLSLFAPYREAVQAGPHTPDRTVRQIVAYATVPVASTSEHARRKARPLARGLVAYFPDALAELSEAIANEHVQHLSEDEIVRAVADARLSDRKGGSVDLGAYDARLNLAFTMLVELQEELTGRAPTHVTSDDFSLFGSLGDALAEVAHVSFVANEQHHPGAPVHWEKQKSADHLDCLLRHYIDNQAGRPVDSDNLRHLAKSSWRILAFNQDAHEREWPDVAAHRQAQRDAAARGEGL